MSDRRKKIQGGVFQHASTAPERDTEALTQQLHRQRPPDELANVDRDHEATVRNRFGAFAITPTGLQVGEEAQQSDWQDLGAYLLKLHGAIQWLIGDWLVFAEDVKWGDIPTIAAQTGIAEKTLYDYTYVARHVQFSVRTEKLSFGHHALVVRKDGKDQRRALQHAISYHLSVSEFRRWLKGESLSPAPLLPLDDSHSWDVMEEVWTLARQKRYGEITHEQISAIRSLLVMVEANMPKPSPAKKK